MNNATDFIAIAKGTAQQVQDKDFREYLLTRLDLMVTFVVQYFQYRDARTLLTMSDPCMLTMRALTQDYCSHTGKNWATFVASDVYLQTGTAFSKYLNEVHLGRSTTANA